MIYIYDRTIARTDHLWNTTAMREYSTQARKAYATTSIRGGLRVKSMLQPSPFL